MKKTAIFLTLCASALLTACSKETKPEAMVDQCTWPDAPTVAAPGWICQEPVEGLELYGVGSHKSSVPHLARQKAEMDGRINLAQQMKVHVSNLLKSYVETTGSGDQETVDQVVTSVSKQITDQTLIGVKAYKARTSPNGTTYVLMGLNAEDVDKMTETALRTSMNNERAAWQQFRAQKGQEELAKEIAEFRKQQGM